MGNKKKTGSKGAEDEVKTESTDHESDISKEESTKRLVSSLAEALKQSLESQNETVEARKIARSPRVFSVGQNFKTWRAQFIQYANLVQLKNSDRRAYLLSLLDQPAFRAVDMLPLPDTLLERFSFAFTANAKRQTSGCCLS